MSWGSAPCPQLSLSPAVAKAAAGLGRAGQHGSAQGTCRCTGIITMSWARSPAAVPEVLVGVLTCKEVPILGGNTHILGAAVDL